MSATESPSVPSCSPAGIIREQNKLRVPDQSAHGWYRFILSFPAHLVRDYLLKFGIESTHNVLDPFCGTGTTLVECKKMGIPSVGVEPNPMAAFASRVKVKWDVDPAGLLQHATNVAARAIERLSEEGIDDEPPLPFFQQKITTSIKLKTPPPEAYKLLLTDSVSPLPLHKTLVLLELLEENRDERYSDHERLALAKCLVTVIGNLHFGPEVGVGVIKPDAAVIDPWLKAVKIMATDLMTLREKSATPAEIYKSDARELSSILQPQSIDAVITSPPYPNEKDYTRTTRLESVLLGLITNKGELRQLKQQLVRSNTRSVYKSDTDDRMVEDHDEIQSVAESIEARRIELGKTSGFERLYARVAKLYFGGMVRHLLGLRSCLKPGAQLAYVVGDQASYLRVMIRTGKLLADIATTAGYEVVGIDLFRTRIATATKQQLREEVVLLRWPGPITVNGWKEKSEDKDMSDEPESTKKANRYSAIIERIFLSKFKPKMTEVPFERVEIEKVASELEITLPKNQGDVIYSFRYRALLPEKIRATSGPGAVWIIRSTGKSKYVFALVPDKPIVPNKGMAITKVPDSTPGVVAKYALSDEQALLAKVRYNRLVDIFTGVTCYSLQNHLRTTVPNMGQVETDELYIGVDKKGAHYVFPIQAKGGNDKISIVQIEQDFAMCAAKFPLLVCRPISAQFMEDGIIALFELENGENGVVISSEKHYKLVAPKEVTDEDLIRYRERTAP